MANTPSRVKNASMKSALAAIHLLLLPFWLQAGCLETLVTIDCRNCSVETVLEQLEEKVECSFSYNVGQLNPDSELSITVTSTTLHETLKHITDDRFKIVERGHHIMMIEKAPKEPMKKKQSYIIEGRIIDSKTGQAIRSATVHAVDNKYTTISNDQGYYKLVVNTEAEALGLSYSKSSYFDTIIIVKPSGKLNQTVNLKPREAAPEKMPMRSLSGKPNEVEELTLVKMLVPEPQRQIALNLAFLENIPVQFSVIPSIGTSRNSSGLKTNILSMNLFAGYNAAVEGVEVGGMVNIVRQHMHGFQAGGIGNIVGSEVKGIQLGGVFNNVRGSVHGVQAAGVYNIVLDTLVGAQMSGVFNILRGSVKGTQLSGLFNVATESMTGLQAAGFMNVTKEEVTFAQAAGFMNYAGGVSGVQLAGFTNMSKEKVTGTQLAGFSNFTPDTVTGTQMAGFMNVAQTIKGSQLAGFANFSGDASTQTSGFINVGKHIEGFQLGVFNFSDSSELSIGLLSFSLKGYNHLDLSANEVQPFNASYRTGSKLFYNILKAGYGSYVGLNNLFSYGYGIGCDLGKPEKRVHTNLELSATQFVHFTNPDPALNLNIRFNPHVSIRLGKKRPSIVAGPSVNMMIQSGTLQNTNPDNGEFLTPRGGFIPVYQSVPAGQTVLTMWVGGKIGLRI